MKDQRPKSSTEYVREFRARMRQAGLVKKDVWIRPEFAAQLSSVERRLRQVPGEAPDESESAIADQGMACWTVQALHAALAQSNLVQSGNIQLRLLDGADPALHLVMREFGDLPIFIAIGGLQIIVQALLWPVDHVTDPASFNLHVLRTHKLLPLSTVGVEPVGGVPCYVMFGSLGITAGLGNILFEVETLAENVIASADAYRPFLREEMLATDWSAR